MPEDFEQMFAYALGHIAHQPEGWLQMKNPAPVQDRLRKAAVAIVMGYQEVKILRSYPAVHLHSRQRLPIKKSLPPPLAAAGELQRINDRRSAKGITFRAGRNIPISSCIH